MYDRVLELITEKFIPDSESPLMQRNQSGRPPFRRGGRVRPMGDTNNPQIRTTKTTPQQQRDADNQARLKSYTDEKGPKRRGLAGKLATAIRRRRAERMMKAAGVNPKTGAVEGPGRDPRSRLEKVIAKRGETIPQYFFNKLASLGRIGKAGKSDPVKSVY